MLSEEFLNSITQEANRLLKEAMLDSNNALDFARMKALSRSLEAKGYEHPYIPESLDGHNMTESDIRELAEDLEASFAQAIESQIAVLAEAIYDEISLPEFTVPVSMIGDSPEPNGDQSFSVTIDGIEILDQEDVEYQMELDDDGREMLVLKIRVK